jgi:hypothetical protein
MMQAKAFAHHNKYSEDKEKRYLEEVHDMLYQANRYGRLVNQNLFECLSFL